MPMPWLDESIAVNGRLVRENFLDWFAQSKVVDGEGNPKVVHHGTRANFDAFDPHMHGTNVRNNPTTRMGFFFTESPTGAQRWAEYEYRSTSGFLGSHAEPKVMSLHLAIATPRTIGVDKFDYFLKSARAATIDKFVEESIAKGFDGLKITYSPQMDSGSKGQDSQYFETWWVAFHSTQIKSAVGNSGLYLKSSPSLIDQDGALELERGTGPSFLELKRALKARGAVIKEMKNEARNAPIPMA
jgi:ADP-Ribosyltransferase in polyvalent proteins